MSHHTAHVLQLVGIPVVILLIIGLMYLLGHHAEKVEQRQAARREEDAVRAARPDDVRLLGAVHSSHDETSPVATNGYNGDRAVVPHGLAATPGPPATVGATTAAAANEPSGPPDPGLSPANRSGTLLAVPPQPAGGKGSPLAASALAASAITSSAAPTAADRAAPPAGWHPDPEGRPGVLRYWDGARWTSHFARSSSD
jgi:hypothetical protein